MISFYTGGHVLFQQVSTRYHSSSSFLLGKWKRFRKSLEKAFLPPHCHKAEAGNATRSWAPGTHLPQPASAPVHTGFWISAGNCTVILPSPAPGHTRLLPTLAFPFSLRPHHRWKAPGPWTCIHPWIIHTTVYLCAKFTQITWCYGSFQWSVSRL